MFKVGDYVLVPPDYIVRLKFDYFLNNFLPDLYDEYIIKPLVISEIDPSNTIGANTCRSIDGKFKIYLHDDEIKIDIPTTRKLKLEELKKI